MNLDFLNPLILYPVLFLLTAVYYLIPGKFRWILLLLVSYGFLYWLGSDSIFILLLSTFINYVIGILIHKSTKWPGKWLVIGILCNILILIFFKYFSTRLNLSVFFSVSHNSTVKSIIFPIGLSFYTVQSISYLVDVYKGLIPAEYHPGIFMVYQAFFPKIISGPIERGKKLIPQLRQPQNFSVPDLLLGSRQILFGLFKKLVIADHLAFFVNEVFDKPGTYQGVTLITGLIFLGFQIYLDFSSYTDIALGSAKILGIKLTSNFERPFLSESLVEFWNRWHISFSTWLRDYIFYPLRRFLLQKVNANNFITIVIPPVLTMLVSGFWHGSAVTFIVWGLYHAFFYTLVIYARNIRKNTPQKGILVRILNIFVNFVVLTIGWLIFRSDSMQTAFIIFKNIFVKSTTLELILRNTNNLDYLISIVSIILITCLEIISEVTKNRFHIDKFPLVLRWGIYLVIILCISIFGVFQKGASPFLYGKF